MKINIQKYLKLAVFAPWGLLGLILSSPCIALHAMIYRKSAEKWETVPLFALMCAFWGLFSPLYSIPYIACEIYDRK